MWTIRLLEASVVKEALTLGVLKLKSLFEIQEALADPETTELALLGPVTSSPRTVTTGKDSSAAG